MDTVIAFKEVINSKSAYFLLLKTYVQTLQSVMIFTIIWLVNEYDVEEYGITRLHQLCKLKQRQSESLYTSHLSCYRLRFKELAVM